MVSKEKDDESIEFFAMQFAYLIATGIPSLFFGWFCASLSLVFYERNSSHYHVVFNLGVFISVLAITTILVFHNKKIVVIMPFIALGIVLNNLSSEGILPIGEVENLKIC